MTKEILNEVILKVGGPNLNGRVYPEEVLREAIEKLNDKPVYGQFGNPDGLIINMDEVSHVVTNIKIQDGCMTGNIRVLDNKYGRALEEALDMDVGAAFRPLGTGNLKDLGDGVTEVYDYEIHSVNLVRDPA